MKALLPPTNIRLHQSGFTLIELISVIVIFGILSATALPKFLSLGKEARIANLNILRGALMSAATMGAAKCVLDPSCKRNISGASIPTTTINGKTIYMHYGYPTGWGKWGVNDSVGGVAELVDMTEFSYQPHNTYCRSEFSLNGAPNPNACRVLYQLTTTGAEPLITVTIESSGC